MRRFLAQPLIEDEQRTSISYYCGKLGPQYYKIPIDIGNSINVISHEATKKLGWDFQECPNQYEAS